MNLIPGINVGNAFRQVGSFVGLAPKGDYDVLDSYTNSNRAGQTQVNNGFDITSGSNTNPTARPAAAPATQPSGGGGTSTLGAGGGAPSGAPALPALNTAAINGTQIALDQLPALLQAALDAENTKYGNLTRAFGDQETAQRGQYDQSTTTNQQNYDANYMDSIRSGIKGLGGLMNLLRGTGAAGGTAQDLVRDTVGGITASDIRGGADTQKANQTSLDTSLGQFLTELKGKRQVADDTFENNKRAVQRDNQSQMQDLYSKMAGYYADGGRTAEANTFMGRAASLTPNIAQNSMSKQSAYDTTPVAVQAPTLTDFSAPTQPDAAVVPENGQVGTGIFTMNRKKENVTQPVALPVGF
jgi:hypothetical protein